MSLSTFSAARTLMGFLLAAAPALAQSDPPSSMGPAAQEPPMAPATATATPRDPKSPVRGFADGRGPTGPVQLRILSPKQGEEIPLPQIVSNGAVVRVSFELENYETFLDPVTKTGQAIAIFLDGLPHFTHYSPSQPWTFRKIAPGTHTLRAVAIRPWGEPIREEGAFASVTFSVGPKAEKNAPAPGEPILTVFSPRFRTKISAAQAAGLEFSFLVTGCTLSDVPGPGNCRLRYRVDSHPEVILVRPDPVRIEGLGPGRHGFAAGITRDNKLVPGAFTLVQGVIDVEDSSSPSTPVAK